jgi:hypothetical protein
MPFALLVAARDVPHQSGAAGRRGPSQTLFLVPTLHTQMLFTFAFYLSWHQVIVPRPCSSGAYQGCRTPSWDSSALIRKRSAIVQVDRTVLEQQLTQGLTWWRFCCRCRWLLLGDQMRTSFQALIVVIEVHGKPYIKKSI